MLPSKYRQRGLVLPMVPPRRVAWRDALEFQRARPPLAQKSGARIVDRGARPLQGGGRKLREISADFGELSRQHEVSWSAGDAR